MKGDNIASMGNATWQGNLEQMAQAEVAGYKQTDAAEHDGDSIECENAHYKIVPSSRLRDPSPGIYKFNAKGKL